MTLVSFFLVPLSNVEFTDSTVGTQPFSRSGFAKCRQRVESCSLKNPRSFRICGYIRTLSETIKPITLALFTSLFSTPFSPLSFSLSYTHFLTLHSHSLSPAYNSHHSDPIPTLARSFASRTPVFSRLSFLLPFALPFSFRSLIVFFLFWKRYRYPPLCLNCRSRDSRPRRARLRGLPPATILPTQQQQGRFTSLIPRHLSSLRD